MITYLDVPYKEKDEAKAAGAVWSSEKRMWYVNGDVSAVCKWLPMAKIHPHMIIPHKTTAYEEEHKANIAVFKNAQEMRRKGQMKAVNARKAMEKANRRKAQGK